MTVFKSCLIRYNGRNIARTPHHLRWFARDFCFFAAGIAASGCNARSKKRREGEPQVVQVRMKKLLQRGVGTRFIASATMACRRGA